MRKTTSAAVVAGLTLTLGSLLAPAAMADVNVVDRKSVV